MIDEATYETVSSTLVVDTGFWLFAKKRMLPAGVVTSIDAGRPQLRSCTSCTEDQVESVPVCDKQRSTRRLPVRRPSAISAV